MYCDSLKQSTFYNVAYSTAPHLDQFLTRDVKYTSRSYATMSVSVCLSVCDICALWSRCNWSRLSLHAWIDGCLLFTDNASPGSSDGMMPGFLVEEGGGTEKLVIVAISLILLTLESGQETRDSFVYINDVDIFIIVCVEFSLVISVENAYLKNGLC